jgi:hypothetical protein
MVMLKIFSSDPPQLAMDTARTLGVGVAGSVDATLSAEPKSTESAGVTSMHGAAPFADRFTAICGEAASFDAMTNVAWSGPG